MTGTPLSFEEGEGVWEPGNEDELCAAVNTGKRPNKERNQHNAGFLDAFMKPPECALYEHSHALPTIQNNAGRDNPARDLGCTEIKWDGGWTYDSSRRWRGLVRAARK